MFFTLQGAAQAFFRGSLFSLTTFETKDSLPVQYDFIKVHILHSHFLISMS